MQAKGGDLNEIMPNDARARSNACWKCGEGGHFHRDCHMFAAQVQTRDNVDTVIGQMTCTLMTNSVVTDMVFKPILKEITR